MIYEEKWEQNLLSLMCNPHVDLILYKVGIEYHMLGRWQIEAPRGKCDGGDHWKWWLMVPAIHYQILAWIQSEMVEIQPSEECGNFRSTGKSNENPFYHQ